MLIIAWAMLATAAVAENAASATPGAPAGGASASLDSAAAATTRRAHDEPPPGAEAEQPVAGATVIGANAAESPGASSLGTTANTPDDEGADATASADAEGLAASAAADADDDDPWVEATAAQTQLQELEEAKKKEAEEAKKREEEEAQRLEEVQRKEEEDRKAKELAAEEAANVQSADETADTAAAVLPSGGEVEAAAAAAEAAAAEEEEESKASGGGILNMLGFGKKVETSLEDEGASATPPGDEKADPTEPGGAGGAAEEDVNEVLTDMATSEATEVGAEGEDGEGDGGGGAAAAGQAVSDDVATVAADAVAAEADVSLLPPLPPEEEEVEVEVETVDVTVDAETVAGEEGEMGALDDVVVEAVSAGSKVEEPRSVTDADTDAAAEAGPGVEAAGSPVGAAPAAVLAEETSSTAQEYAEEAPLAPHSPSPAARKQSASTSDVVDSSDEAAATPPEMAAETVDEPAAAGAGAAETSGTGGVVDVSGDKAMVSKILVDAKLEPKAAAVEAAAAQVEITRHAAELSVGTADATADDLGVDSGSKSSIEIMTESAPVDASGSGDDDHSNAGETAGASVTRAKSEKVEAVDSSTVGPTVQSVATPDVDAGIASAAAAATLPKVAPAPAATAELLDPAPKVAAAAAAAEDSKATPPQSEPPAVAAEAAADELNVSDVATPAISAAVEGAAAPAPAVKAPGLGAEEPLPIVARPPNKTDSAKPTDGRAAENLSATDWILGFFSGDESIWQRIARMVSGADIEKEKTSKDWVQSSAACEGERHCLSLCFRCHSAKD